MIDDRACVVWWADLDLRAEEFCVCLLRYVRDFTSARSGSR
jgi:hypothetical protein